jgi:hypothetical protein
VGYCYPSGLEKTLCKWEVYVPLVTKGLKEAHPGMYRRWGEREQQNVTKEFCFSTL